MSLVYNNSTVPGYDAQAGHEIIKLSTRPRSDDQKFETKIYGMAHMTQSFINKSEFRDQTDQQPFHKQKMEVNGQREPTATRDIPKLLKCVE